MSESEDIHRTPGSSALATIVGSISQRLDDIHNQQSRIAATVEVGARDIAEVKIGMNGMIPRVDALERHNIVEEAAIGTIEQRRVMLAQLREAHEHAIEHSAGTAETKATVRGIAWMAAKILTLLGLGWLAAKLGLKMPEVP